MVGRPHLYDSSVLSWQLTHKPKFPLALRSSNSLSSVSAVQVSLAAWSHYQAHSTLPEHLHV